MANKRFPADMADFTATADKFLVVKADGTVGYSKLAGMVLNGTAALVILKSSGVGNEFIQFQNNVGQIAANIGQTLNGSSDLYYDLRFNNAHRWLTTAIERMNLTNTGLMIGDGVATQKLELGGVASNVASYIKVSRNNGNLLMGVNLSENAIYSRTETDAAKNFKLVVGSTDALTILANTNATFGGTLTNSGPSMVRRANQPAQYTQIDTEQGAANILSKNTGTALYPQMLFSQGNNTTDREMARFDGSGNFIALGTITCTTLNQTSTRETKNVQGTFEDDALSIIKNLSLHKFTYKNFDQVLKTPEILDEEGNVTTPAEFERVELPAGPGDQLNVGLLYDEVETNPYISTGNGSIQVNNLLFMALKAIQQLEAKNTELTQRIEALEG